MPVPVHDFREDSVALTEQCKYFRLEVALKRPTTAVAYSARGCGRAQSRTCNRRGTHMPIRLELAVNFESACGGSAARLAGNRNPPARAGGGRLVKCRLQS